jgi:hypothetical protein
LSRAQSQSLQCARRGSVRALEALVALAELLPFLLIMARSSYDRTRATVHIDPHGPHIEGPIELDVLDFIARLSVHILEPYEPSSPGSKTITKS